MRSNFGMLAVLALGSLTAQNPPLTPTSNLVLDTTPTAGVFAYSHIDIPAGVRVTFTGTNPVQIYCDGDAVIHGQIDVDANGRTGGPGSVQIGRGAAGIRLGPGNAILCPTPRGAGPGRHNYGSALPLDLRGGSPGGDVEVWGPGFMTLYCFPLYTDSGGGGGGTLALAAGGQIDVHGVVSANGGRGGLFTGCGSGGTILLRGDTGLTVHPTGSVTAKGRSQFASATGDDGLIRLDAYAESPFATRHRDSSTALGRAPQPDRDATTDHRQPVGTSGRRQPGSTRGLTTSFSFPTIPA